MALPMTDATLPSRNNVAIMVHAYHCNHVRCRFKLTTTKGIITCHDAGKIVLRLKCHYAKCQHRRQCTPSRMWSVLTRTHVVGQNDAGGIDKTNPFWRTVLLTKREAVARRTKLLMGKWRALVRCHGPLKAAHLRAAERVYAPGANGFVQCREEFVALSFQ